MLLKRTDAASRDVAWHVYYYNRIAKPRLLATSLLVKSASADLQSVILYKVMVYNQPIVTNGK